MKWPFRLRRAAAVAHLDPQAAYSLWAEHYPPHAHNRLMEIEQQALLDLLPVVTGLTVLDAGCGTGRYLRELRERGAAAIGIDLSPAMLARARTIAPMIARADLRALPFQAGSIDVVICGLALGDFDEIELALAEIARVLRPAGSVIYSVVHPAGGVEGWSRTFDAGGRHFAVDGYWHSLERHRRACTAAGLTIDEWREPALGTSARRAALIVRAGNRQ